MSVVAIGGRIFRTGCNPVDDPKKLNVFANIKDVGLSVVTKEDAINYCNTKTFMARTYFGADWIGNQGNYGSCNGYAGAKALQRARVRRRLKLVVLSGEGLYAQINGNSDNGSQLVDGMAKIQSVGVPREELIPPRSKIYKSQFPQGWDKDAARFRAEECYALTSEWDIVTALVLGFDVVVAVHVGNNWQQMDSKGVIPFSPGVGNHAVGVDDIRYTGRFEFEHYGSWSPNIHSQGRAFLSWEGHLATTVRYHGFYAIRSTSDDTEDTDNPVPLKV